MLPSHSLDGCVIGDNITSATSAYVAMPDDVQMVCKDEGPVSKMPVDPVDCGVGSLQTECRRKLKTLISSTYLITEADVLKNLLERLSGANDYVSNNIQVIDGLQQRPDVNKQKQSYEAATLAPLKKRRRIKGRRVGTKGHNGKLPVKVGVVEGETEGNTLSMYFLCLIYPPKLGI